MQSDWAAENLQVIRTLMERSAIYRRALGPMTTFAGGLGTAAAIAGVLSATGTGAGINTSYIERLNATFRSAMCPLVRRGRSVVRGEGG